jgi:malonate-semialdehyde dehydrogenase (acetylating)/methylmalonate-semialdehyde dehydrogenase
MAGKRHRRIQMMSSATVSAVPFPPSHWIAGQPSSAGAGTLSLRSPVDGAALGQLPLADASVVDAAVRSAAEAFAAWSKVPVKDRVQVLYKFKEIAQRRLPELAACVSRENGKTEDEAAAGVLRGLEVVEFACGLPALMGGEIMEVSHGVDCYTRRYPLGVVAGITPFNFPAMVPLWMFPMAIGCGNVFILKPSEQTPASPRWGHLSLLLGYLPSAFTPCAILATITPHLLPAPGPHRRTQRGSKLPRGRFRSRLRTVQASHH